MNITDLYKGEKKPISVELRPPLKHKPGNPRWSEVPLSKKVDLMLKPLYNSGVSYVSVTHHPSTNGRHHLIDTARELQDHYPTVAHITGWYHDESEVEQIVQEGVNAGVTNYLALRGDPPTNGKSLREVVERDGLEMTCQLVALSAIYPLSVAVPSYPQGHPRTTSENTFNNFREKVDAGATYSFTQMIFSVSEYEQFLNQCQRNNINVPIIPTIYFPQIVEDLEFVTGDRIGLKLPPELNEIIECFHDDPVELSLRLEDYMIRFTRNLLDVAPGLHYISLNQTNKTAERISLLR